MNEQDTQIGVLRIYLRSNDRAPRSSRWWKSWLRREISHQLVYAAHADGLAMAVVRRSHLGFINRGPIVDDAATDIPNPNAVVLIELAGKRDELRAFVERHRTQLINSHIQFGLAEQWSLPPAGHQEEETGSG
ncbi:MAG: hypothetical protein KC438_08950 [Thermomicrobiales bacterium]|nr:hypothetical protein [Thermomicrobiales bacterium]MCO5222712.1 hypothetical protein [Thermomicrobiales bacterium]